MTLCNYRFCDSSRKTNQEQRYFHEDLAAFNFSSSSDSDDRNLVKLSGVG